MRHSGPRWAALATLLVLAIFPSAAHADWLFTPFVGGAFAGSTVLPDLEQGEGTTQFVLGGTAGWWSTGIFGVETDFGYAPRFFETDNLAGNITNSNVVTLGANVVIAMPLSVTRESLRPYLVAGLGWMHASIDEIEDIFPDIFGRPQNSIGMNIGGGVVGFVTRQTGFRFELRQFNSLERDTSRVTGERESLLSFWRITAGVVIRP